MTEIVGVPGGAKAAITSTAVAVDCTALAGRRCLIWSDDQDIWFCFAASGASTALVTGSTVQAASATALVADRGAVGTGKPRLVSAAYPFLIVKTVSGAGTVTVKPISHVDSSQ